MSWRRIKEVLQVLVTVCLKKSQLLRKNSKRSVFKWELGWSCGGDLTRGSHRQEKFGSVNGERLWVDQYFCCVLSSDSSINFIISFASSFILFLPKNKLICQRIRAPISTTIIVWTILFFLKSSIGSESRVWHVMLNLGFVKSTRGYVKKAGPKLQRALPCINI